MNTAAVKLGIGLIAVVHITAVVLLTRMIANMLLYRFDIFRPHFF
jgi:hypothetical protein